MTSTLARLQIAAVAVAVAVGATLVWDHVSNRDPLATRYQAASDAFSDGRWQAALEKFNALAADHPDHLPALRGQANALVQFGDYDRALAIMTTVIAAEPDNACNYATRGIIQDHRGAHGDAMTNYARAVSGCEAARDGMSWFDRLLSNTHEQPPTVAARLAYLRAQMTLPEQERVLRLPEKDRMQKPWAE